MPYNGRKRNASRTTRAHDKEMPDKIRSKGQTFAKIANLCYGGRRGVWFHVPCDERRKHNNVRDADNSPLCKGNLCDYVDRSWWLVLFNLLLVLL